MVWLFSAAVLAGVTVGFVAGASPSPAGRVVSTGVAAFIAGLLTGLKTDGGVLQDVHVAGQLGIAFLLPLLGTYMVANVLRKHGLLVWMGIRGPSLRTIEACA